MAATKYTYSIQNDFPNHKVATDRLSLEIEQSAIVTALDYIETIADNCDIWFKAALSPGDVTILDGIVATHSGEPLPGANPVTLVEPSGIPIPSTSDGKPVFLPNLFPGDVLVYFPGVGDNVGSGTVGGGADFIAESDVAGDTVVDWQFIDWVYMAGGTCFFKDAVIGDRVSYSLYAPANVVTPNGGGTGNCNVVGGMIIPAPGNGAYDVNLATAVPVPSPTTTGHYDWIETPTGPGSIVENTTSKGGYNLYAVQLVLSNFVRDLPLMGTGEVTLTVPAIKPKKILPQWKCQVKLHNSGHAGLKITWGLVTARTRTA